MTSQMVSLDNLVGLVSFFGIFGFRGVNTPKVEKLGTVMILREIEKSLIQEWAGGHFLGVLYVTKIGGFEKKKNMKYIAVQIKI